MELKIIKWVSWEEAEEYPDVDASSYDLHEAILVNTLIEKGYIMSGATHQGIGVPIFSDGTKLAYSMRSWGSIMASVRNIVEKTDHYDYMSFYMLEEEREILP